MVIARIMGGLGNQMFQYSFGRALALRNDVPLKLDLTSYDVSMREYRLNRFRIVEEIASPAEVEKLTGIHRGSCFGARVRRRIRRHLRRVMPPSKMPVLTEHESRFDPAVLQPPGHVYLDGYWQSERYFAGIEDLLRKELIVRERPDRENERLLAEIGASESVSVHVRRGDYVSDLNVFRVHGVCPPEYYHAAVRRLAEVLGEPHIYIFSDDIPWAKENLRFEHPTTCVEHNGEEKDWEDFRLMSACRHHVIANSSFSWWAAWLCPNPDKIVIAPERWFADPRRDSSDIAPRSWWRI